MGAGKLGRQESEAAWPGALEDGAQDPRRDAAPRPPRRRLNLQRQSEASATEQSTGSPFAGTQVPNELELRGDFPPPLLHFIGEVPTSIVVHRFDRPNGHATMAVTLEQCAALLLENLSLDDDGLVSRPFARDMTDTRAVLDSLAISDAVRSAICELHGADLNSFDATNATLRIVLAKWFLLSAKKVCPSHEVALLCAALGAVKEAASLRAAVLNDQRGLVID